MSRNRLILNGKAVPLPPDAEIAITYQARDIRNLASFDGAYAETLVLPDTSEVRAALEHSELVTSATDTPYKLLPASLESGFNTVLQGVAGHTEVNEGFSIDLNGLNADWFESIRDKNLQELALSEFDHAYNPTNVAAANTHLLSRGYLYPLANYGYWTNRYLDGTNQHFTELFPAVYVKTLLEKMAGSYTLTGSLLTDPRFTKMVVPFTNGRLRYRESYRQQYNLTSKTSINRTYTSPLRVQFDNATPAGYWANNGEYVTPVNGWYKVKAVIKLSVQCHPDVVNTLRISHKDIHGAVHELTTAEVRNGDNQQITLEINTHLLNPAEKLYVFYNVGYGEGQPNNTQMHTGSTFEVELQNAVAPYGQMHLDANLPDLSQEDLVMTVCNLFNVLIQTDPIQKVVRLDLLEDIKSKPVVDWSGKIDWTVKPRTTFALADYAQKNIIGFEPLEYPDSFGQERQDIAIIPIANERLEAENELYISPFTSTEERPAFRNTVSLPYIPMVTVKVDSFGLWRDWVEYSAVDHVYWGGNYWKGLTTNTNLMPGYGSTDWEIVSIDDVLEFGGATPRLLLVEPRGTGRSVPVGENAIGGTHTLLNTQAVFNKPDGSGINAEAMRYAYHGITAKMLTQTRLLTLDVRLKLPDVNQLDFLRPVMLNIPAKNLEGLFYLNKVSQFNPDNNASTEVELVRLYGLPLATASSALHLEYSEEYSDEYN